MGREGLITQIRACCDLGHASYCYFDCEWPYIITGYIICSRYIQKQKIEFILDFFLWSLIILDIFLIAT